MKSPPLTPDELSLISRVLFRHPEVALAKLFGSRAKGTHAVSSDVDLALCGALSPLMAEAISAELDELPLPYRFEVQPFESISNAALREHIERVGRVIYERKAVPAVGRK